MATHPLDVVKEEIAARGITKKEFAARLGMAASNLSRMFREKQNITTSFAEKLEQALDIDASFWLGLQTSYNKDVNAIAERDERENVAIALERMMASLLDVKTLYARLKINTSCFIQDKIKQLYEALGMTPSMESLLLACNCGEFKHSEVLSIDEKQMNTWALLAYISARQNVPSKPFVKGGARKAAAEIARRVHRGVITEEDVHSILDENGISYSVVPKLEKTPVDGYSIYADEYPAIVTTHRHDDMSCLIFNVMHELGHTELHLRKGDKTAYIAKKGDYSSENKKEKEANIFAEDMLIDPALWRKMISDARVKGLWGANIAKELRKISADNHLDFGIVSWRYRYETNNYAIKGLKRTPIH